MVFFTDAEPTNLCDGIVGGSSFNYIPFDVIGNVVPSELPDILTECGPLVLLIQCIDVRVVLVVSGLHKIVSTTSISFPVVGVSPGHSCLVNQVIYHAANARENFAGFRCLFRFTGTSICLGCCSIVVVDAF